MFTSSSQSSLSYFYNFIDRNVNKYLIDWDKKSRSKIQFKTKQFLKEYWENHIVYEEFPVYGTRLKVDILNATKKIAVEVNGSQHSSFNKFFHGNSRQKFLQSIKRDCKKLDWLEVNGFEVIEIESILRNSKSLFSKSFVYGPLLVTLLLSQIDFNCSQNLS